MRDEKKTKKELLGELVHLRQKITQLERKENKHMQTEKELEESKETLKTIVEVRESAARNRSLLVAIPDLIFRLDKEAVFLEFIPAKEFSLVKPLKGFLGRNVHDVFDPETSKKFSLCVKKAVKTGDTQILPYQLSFKGKIYHYEARIAACGNGEVLAIVRDFTKQKEAETLAEIDPLTNVYNRRKFSELLDQEIERVERYNRALSVVLLDIDYFKKINDTYGHDVGDYVLKRMTKLIKENIRRVDTLARYGGEEFVVILPETGIKGAMAVAERIRRVIEETSFNKVDHVTISAGVSVFKDGDNHQSVVKKADNALYVAKREGRNRISVL